ncbi:hypothetical protein LSM04_009074 [Trypanosoma melophagium]|uniref:uncharacterized protein n=1 Tax=Trypanosoma melophagium TaxID=715481 RepID=UPI00351A5E8D|nr:hypothetical protein LSM04_009074 [Trypanosoma melophagium]
MSEKSRRNSVGSGRGVATQPELHTSRRASLRSRSLGNGSGEHYSQGSLRSGDMKDNMRGRKAVPTSARNRDRSGSIGDKCRPQRAGSNSSRAFTKSPGSDQVRGTPLRVSNGVHEKSRNGRGNSRERQKSLTRDELLHLLRQGGPLTDIRPDMYRLDLSQKDDLRFLYETQHRVDPELVPITKHITPSRWKQMNESHIFDPPPTPKPRKPSASDEKKNDGLGSLARFLLNAEDQAKSPAKGRGHRHCDESGSALWLFGGNDNNGIEGNVNTPRHTPLRIGKRLVPNHSSDHLGRDLLAREPLTGEIVTRHGVRTIKTVQAFESTQPKLTLPPRRQSARFTNAMRTHSAAADNDIFGVRKRREHMAHRSRSASVPSNDPYGTEDGDGVSRRQRSSRRSEASSKCVTERQSNAPFGEEEGRRVSRTRGRQSSSQRSSLRSVSTGSVVSSTYIKEAKQPHSSRRSVSSRGSQRRKDGAESYVSTSYETASCTTSAMWDEDEQQHQRLRHNQRSSDLLVSPRVRTGRARVPGRSSAPSNVIFGGGEAIQSPRLTQQNAQLRSTQMHNVLSWA